jgi:Predicted membrane protein (DUF2306)
MSSQRRFFTAFNALACALIALVSFRYLLGAGPVPPLIAQNALREPWLVLHAGAGATALLLSPLQLMPSLRRRAPKLHRGVGIVYVLGCTLGAASGAVLAYGSAAGIVASVGFGSLSLVWLFTTTAGWLAAARGRAAQHGQWMLRSFSLTYAAVTLRVYLAVLPLLPVAFLNGYRAIAFLCWVPNLLVAELLLRRARAQSATTSSSASWRPSASLSAPLHRASASPPR